MKFDYSYDYDSPISEGGDLTDKFQATLEIINNYNPVKTRTPDAPETPERVTFDDIEVN